MIVPSDKTSRRVMALYIGTGLALTALMMLAGLMLRASQAQWLPMSPGQFYAVLTLHGAGVIVGMMLCGMGGLWFLMRRQTDLNATAAVLAYAFIAAGVVAVVVSTLVGGFAALYTFLTPLPFYGSWPYWSTGVFLIGMTLITMGWMAWCMQMLGGVLRAYDGALGALAWDYVWHRKKFDTSGRKLPPPEAFPALMAGFDGLLAGMSAMLLGMALFVHWVDAHVLINPLWAKNLTYFFAHTYANLIIYMLVALIYVGLPYATGRKYHTSTVLVIGWWCSLVLTLTNYFHHLYMDFVQPGALQYIGELSSYLSAVPVTVVTIFSALMLVWRSGMKWTLGAIFMYTGLIGWVVGGIGAEIDATVPFNTHLHNTLSLTGAPIYKMVFWWMGFLVLTIVGERLELSRLLPPSSHKRWTFRAAAGLFALGMTLTLIFSGLGEGVAGIGLLALAVWLFVYDVARRTVRQHGLTRFIGVCLLTGYFWLGLGGILTVIYTNIIPAMNGQTGIHSALAPGLAYDAVLHAIFLGFVFGMIFGHAPIIFPAVLGVRMVYSRRFYLHLLLLEGSVAWRVISDLTGSWSMRQWAGLINGLAILLFLVNTVTSIRWKTESPAGAPVRRTP